MGPSRCSSVNIAPGGGGRGWVSRGENLVLREGVAIVDCYDNDIVIIIILISLFLFLLLSFSLL